jgi:protein-S-isoprenylcysteine O-methyltransferase Ste14
MTIPTELLHYQPSAYFDALSAAIFLPLPLVLWPIPIGIPFWIIYLWTRVSEQQIHLRERSPRIPATDFDSGSWPLINHGWRLIRVAAFVVSFVTPPWAHGTTRGALYCFGLILMISGTLLRRHCFRMLGDRFTYTVRVSEESEIVKRGIYKWVRHPSYTGGMLYNLGIGLALTNWESAILIVVAMFIMYFYRVRVEERALLNTHKADYREYMQQTKRFVPFIF